MKKTSKSDQTQKLLNTVSSERKEKMMFILSQDKTRIFNMQGHIEGIGYEEENFKKGKKEEIRHTIQVFDGCAEEIAEYECKEDCLLVLYAIFKAIEQGGKTAERTKDCEKNCREDASILEHRRSFRKPSRR